jgi:hypothetical protein
MNSFSRFAIESPDDDPVMWSILSALHDKAPKRRKLNVENEADMNVYRVLFWTPITLFISPDHLLLRS